MKKRKTAAIALFFILLTVIGLLTIRNYTGSYDELPQQEILRVNLHQYAVWFEKLGFQTDSGLWGDTPLIRNYIERDHGIAPMYVCAPFLGIMSTSRENCSLIWCSMIWFWFMAGVYSLYAIARHFGLSRPLSCLCALMLYLSPQFFAHAHFNDKDLVLFAMTMLTLWQGARFLKKMTITRGILFALFAALAANMRIIGILPFCAIGLCCILLTCFRKEWSAQRILTGIAVVLLFVLFYALLTPAFLADPADLIRYSLANAKVFSRWSGVIWFRDASFLLPDQPLPRYYLAYMILTTTPVYILMLFITGGVFFIRNLFVKKAVFFRNEQDLILLAGILTIIFRWLSSLR